MVVSAADGWTHEDSDIFEDMLDDHVNTGAGVTSSGDGSRGPSKVNQQSQFVRSIPSR